MIAFCDRCGNSFNAGPHWRMPVCPPCDKPSLALENRGQLHRQMTVAEVLKASKNAYRRGVA